MNFGDVASVPVTQAQQAKSVIIQCKDIIDHTAPYRAILPCSHYTTSAIFNRSKGSTSLRADAVSSTRNLPCTAQIL
jgi:hypothetical protein